jgi:UDP-glucose 6-dehydrogenase
VLMVGAGVVGSATGEALQHGGHAVTYHDPPKGLVIDDASGYQVALLCVPTPEGANGAVDRSYILRAAEYLEDAGFAGFCGIRSTVPPGTCVALQTAYSRFRWFSWPEFLRERTATYDAQHPKYAVLGTKGVDGAGELVGLVPACCMSVRVVTPTQAEFAKYATNCLLAASVGVANELAELGALVGFDWNAVMPSLCSRDRNMPRNVQIIPPGGFGGKCLPKDLAGLLAYADSHYGRSLPVLQAVHDENRKRRDDL